MDILSNKAVLIGFGVLITIIVMTGVLFAVNQIKEIYGYVDKNDISVVKEFEDIFNSYNGAKMNGVDLVNTIRRFEGSLVVSVTYPESQTAKTLASNGNPSKREATYINDIMKEGTNALYRYEKEYNVRVEYLDNNQKMKIIFE